MLRSALPASKDARRVLLGTLFSAVGRGLTLPFLYIYLTQVRGLEGWVVGYLLGWMGFVSLLLAPVGGTLVDRFGARRVVIPLLIVEVIGNGSLAFVDGAWSAFGSLTIIALGFAALWSGQNTILASLVAPQERQRAFGLSFTLLNLGIGTGGLIAGSFVDIARPFTFQLLYFGDGASFLVPLVILLSLPHVGRRLVAEPTEKPAEAAKQGGYLLVLRDKAFVQFFLFGLVLTTFGYAQIEVGFTGYANSVVHVSPRVIAWAFAGNTLLIVLAQLFVLRWLEGRSRTRALAVVGIVFALSWLVLGLGGWATAAGVPIAAAVSVIACSVIFAFGETFMSPIMPAITNALATDELRGRYNALGSMMWGLSAVVGPIGAGLFIGAGRATTWLILVIGGSLLACLLALRLHHRLTPDQDGRPHATPTGSPAPAGSPATVVS